MIRIIQPVHFLISCCSDFTANGKNILMIKRFLGEIRDIYQFFCYLYLQSC